MSPKILLFDIETKPNQAYVWGMWKQNIAPGQLIDEWEMLTWAAKWLHKRRVMSDSVHKHKSGTDYEILLGLRDLLNEADIVIGHNARRFDRKKANARFIKYDILPPSPYRVIDTLDEAKKNFAFTSNRLDALGKYLGVGQKLDTGGFDLWARCCNGEKAAFKEMLAYNREDVRLLERVYLKMLPWMQNHPNLGVYGECDEPVCRNCGSEDLHWRGFAYTQVGKYHRYHCQDCGSWGQSRFTILGKEERENLVK